jgi:hypothetical protein
MKQREVSIGFTTIRIYSEAEFLSRQIGYSVDSKGSSLAGNGKGNWLEEWIVVGYDDSCGDPIFVNVNVQSYPGLHCRSRYGRMECCSDCRQFEAFRKSLNIVSDLAKGREYPTLLQKILWILKKGSGYSMTYNNLVRILIRSFGN